MARGVFILLVLLATLLTALVSLIHSSPYDDRQLDDLFHSVDGCEPPCFLGVTPNVTPLDEAEALLHAHPWVSAVRRVSDAQLEWEWNGQQPRALSPLARGRMWVYTQTIGETRVQLSLSMGDLWLQLGRPDNGDLIKTIGSAGLVQNGWYNMQPISHRAIYAQRGVRLQSHFFCPLTLDNFWNAWVELQFSHTDFDIQGYDVINWMQNPYLCAN